MDVLLTVDWDFFFDNKLTLADIGHKENKFFIEELWMLRHDLLDIRPVPLYKSFWNELNEIGLKPHHAYVGESHIFAYNIFDIIKAKDITVVNFDTHSDCWDGRDIVAQNWLKCLYRVKTTWNFIWVYPEWGEHFGKCPRKRFKKVPYSELSNYIEDTQVLLTYIARSGAWTPPWCDKFFYDLLKPLNVTYMDDEYPVSKPREFDLKAMLKLKKQVEKMSQS